MIFLSKDLTDPYINAYARALGCTPIDPASFVFEDSTDPIVLRGIGKKKILHRCWRENRDFYFIDTGYFGNEMSLKNPNGWKYWHRIVKNNLQHGDIIDRPKDRFRSFNKKFKPWKKSGDKILIAAPDEKPCKFYGIDLDEWLTNTISEIKKFTDRPVEVRQRTKNRQARMFKNSFEEAIKDNIFALVTFNSNAAVESIFQGVPAFVLSPVHAASPVAKKDISQIENPYYASSEELEQWANHLAYGMVHTSELKSGKAKDIMDMQ